VTGIFLARFCLICALVRSESVLLRGVHPGCSTEIGMEIIA